MTFELPKIELPREELVALIHRLADAVAAAEITVERIDATSFGTAGGMLGIHWKPRPVALPPKAPPPGVWPS